jgi:uncharacterized membrane protein
MNRMLFVGLIAMMAVLAPPTTASADFLVCNKSVQREIKVAFGFYDETNGWTGKGWWRVQKGRCARPFAGALTASVYYVYAEAGKLRWSGADEQDGGSFCIGSEQFALTVNEFTRAEGDVLDCTAADLTEAKFIEVNVGQAQNSTYNLTD